MKARSLPGTKIGRLTSAPLPLLGVTPAPRLHTLTVPGMAGTTGTPTTGTATGEVGLEGAEVGVALGTGAEDADLPIREPLLSPAPTASLRIKKVSSAAPKIYLMPFLAFSHRKQ